MGRLPVGVVGVGALGRHHARHLAQDPECLLVGVHDIDPTRGEAVAREVDSRFFPDLDDLLKQVEAVSIAVPTPVHADVGLQVLDRGRAVFMEKPLAASLEEADTLLGRASTGGIPFQVGHIERFNRAIRAASPYLGDIRFFESTRLAPFQPRGTDVAVVLDLMIHDLDLILYLTRGATVTDVRANGVTVLTPHLDMASARVEFATGAVANVTTSRVARGRTRKLRLFQPNGYFSLDLGTGRGEFMRLRSDSRPGAPTTLGNVVERIPLTAPEADALSSELRSFVRSVRGGQEVVVSGAEGRAALALALRVAEAVQSSP